MGIIVARAIRHVHGTFTLPPGTRLGALLDACTPPTMKRCGRRYESAGVTTPDLP